MGEFNFTKEFSECPQLVRKDPFRLGLLPSAVWEGFLKMPLPVPTEFWVAQSRGVTLGRVGANISMSHPGIGYVGFFEVDPVIPEARAVATGLLEKACHWLKTKGAGRALGPLNFNTWFPYRLRTGPQGDLRFAWEPVNPPEYVNFMTSFGFSELERYHSVGNQDLDAVIEKTKSSHEQALAAGYKIRNLDSANLIAKEVPMLYEISMQGFKDNFLFEPIPLDAFKQLYVPIANKADISLARAVTDAKGRDVGFFLIFEDQDYMVMKTVAVKPEARGKGLSNALVYSAALAAKQKGLDRCISALVKSGAQSESYAKKSKFLWKHEYALFQKDL